MWQYVVFINAFKKSQIKFKMLMLLFVCFSLLHKNVIKNKTFQSEILFMAVLYWKGGSDSSLEIRNAWETFPKVSIIKVNAWNEGKCS